MNIGYNIKINREKIGLTQENLANELNVTTRTIQNYESGDRQPSIDVLNEIANIFKIPITQLIEPSQNLKDTKITLNKIEFLYDEWSYERDGREITRVKNLKAIAVDFSYKNIRNATMQVNTDKELTIEEIKERILSELKG